MSTVTMTPVYRDHDGKPRLVRWERIDNVKLREGERTTKAATVPRNLNQWLKDKRAREVSETDLEKAEQQQTKKEHRQ